MNRTLAENIRRKLMPALEQSQGFAGTYNRGNSFRPIVVIPTKPEWLSSAEEGSVITQWKGLEFSVSSAAWAATGFDVPELDDRLTVTLADGKQQTYALLPPKGMRPYEQSAESGSYFLRMKLVSN
jgi:hypothetical protein